MVKSAAERSIEAMTWASVVIWLGFTLIARLLDYPWLVVMVLSIILLSSAIYQRSQGWQTSLAIWVFGIWMAVFSVIETVNALIIAITGSEGLTIGIGVYMGIALVSMGVAVIFRTVQFMGGRPPAQQPVARNNTVAPRPSYAPPQRVEDISANAYTPPLDRRARPTRGQAPAPQYDPLATSIPDDAGYDQGGDPGYNQTGYVQSGTRRIPTSATGRQRSAGSTARTQIDPQDNYGYAQPDNRRAPAPQTGRQTGYTPPSRAPRTPQANYGYDQPSDYQDQASYQEPPAPPAPRPSDRRRVSPQRSQAAPPPADSSSDLENRVEDIIRRSRERRNTPPEDLPY